MSEAITGISKNAAFVEEYDIYDPYGEVPVNQFFSSIEYQEWNDADINAEVWDERKSKVGTESSVEFEDWQLKKLPPKIENVVKSWKKPQFVFPGAKLTVYDPRNENFTLQVPSPIGNCDLFDAFNESITTLQFLASKYGFPVELEGPGFVSNTQGEQWRPWHHIYASCKAGKGTVHKPQYHPSGKYFVRLFYMGAWRKFIVDDQIPCDENGDCMFPVTQIPGELWPIILMKGFLKIFTSPPYSKDIPFFSIFTGWVEWRMMANNKTYEEIWRRLVLLTPKYEVPGNESTSTITQNVSFKKEPIKQSNEFCFVLAYLKFLNDMKIVVVRSNRDKPLVKASRKESTKPWKKIRWVHWALERGLWTDERTIPPYRRIYCINFLHDLGQVLLPDPEHETLLFDIAEDEEEGIQSYNASQENEEWYDYNKFYDCLSYLSVYFKPSTFSFRFKVTSLISPLPEVVKSAKESTAGAKTKSRSQRKPSSPEPLNSFNFSPTMSRNCNEPPLLFCESSTGIFICISLSVYPEYPTNIEICRSEPEFLKGSFASLLVERFDWRTPLQGDIVGATKTVGVSSIVLNLKPGRHVFKLWLSTNCPYVITVHSNVKVDIHKGPKIRFLLHNEGERILHYINKVSNAFISLTQKFGKPDLRSSLKEFYATIKPGNDAAPDYLRKMDDFIETFLYCILLSLKSLISVNDELRIMMGALQSLFIDPEIYYALPKSTQSYLAERSPKKPRKKVEPVIQPVRALSELLAFPWSPESIEKVVFIQKVFRGFRTRLLWKYQTPARKEFKLYTDRLKKICDTIFVPSKREVEVGKLIRRIFTTDPNLLITFKFHNDFHDIIDVLEFTGKVANVEPFAWVPIARFMITCNSDFPLPCAFYLTCNLEQFVIHGADNDTNEEIFRLSNGISPRYYHRNRKGYTIFIYGWNEARTKTVNWRLHMVRMKYFDSLHICNMTMSQCTQDTLPVIEVFDLRNFYVPNSKARLCRCLIKIHRRTLLTLRLSASHPGVNFVLTISLDKRFASGELQPEASDEIIAKVNSVKGAALISSLYLDHCENNYLGESDSDCTEYILEALILNNSWPLTTHEWGVIEPFRVNGISKDGLGSVQSKRGSSESRKKMSRRSSSEIKAVEQPFWFLQIVNESQSLNGSQSQGFEGLEDMIVEEDKSFIEYVKNMKYHWEEKDPGRRIRGNDLRMEFLRNIWFESKSFTSDGEGIFDYSNAEDDDLPEFKEMLRRLSNFSYLLEDTTIKRYNKSPRVLPKMPTNKLLLHYKRDEFSSSLLNISNDYPQSCSSTEITGNIDEVEAQEFDFLLMCLHYRQVMTNHMKEEEKLSNQLMKKAYEGRLKAIKNLTRIVE